MLVLSRKKSEAILIDGVLRIEVVNVAKATVRVRLMAPRSLQLPHGIARKETRDRHDSPASISPVAMDVVHMTLVNQQVVPLGESVSLGVVDADKSRVVFLVDAPVGTCVMAVDPEGLDRANASSNQILLQFMGQGTERLDEHPEQQDPGVGSREGQTPSDESSPDVLPFPSKSTRQASSVKRPRTGLVGTFSLPSGRGPQRRGRQRRSGSLRLRGQGPGQEIETGRGSCQRIGRCRHRRLRPRCPSLQEVVGPAIDLS